VVLELQEEVVVFRQVVEALHRVEVVALHHREGEAYRQGGVAAFHQQLAEAVALHRVVVVFLDLVAGQLQN
jgi:hypothetical protein